MAAPPSLRRSRVFFSSADLVLQRNEEARQRRLSLVEEEDENDLMPVPPASMLRCTSSTCSTMTNPHSNAGTLPDWARNMTPSKGGLIDEDDEDEQDNDKSFMMLRRRSSSSFALGGGGVSPLVARHMDLSAGDYSAQERALYESAIPMDVPQQTAASGTTFVLQGGLDSALPIPQWAPSRTAGSMY